MMIAALVMAPLVVADVPLAPPVERSLVATVGADLNAPVVDVAVAPRAFDNGLLPFVAVSAGLSGPRLAVAGGLQLRHDICPGFFVRGSVTGGGFVAGAVSTGAGVSAGLDVDAGFILGPVDILVGPVVDAAASGDSARVTPGGGVTVVVDTVDHVEVVAAIEAGYDFGGVYGNAGDGAFAASFGVGVRLSL